MKDNVKKALFGFIESKNSEKYCIAIVLLRVMATCLITNTHYNNVYPNEKFAIGGLLGDVIFFAVSGFCFAGGIKASFSQWYTKRWIRIYPSVLIMTVIFVMLGFWQIPDITLSAICMNFILPTNFLFFGAIMICYIPMYFTANAKSNRNFYIIAASWFVLYVLFYVFCVDKATYLMNAVSHPIVLFLYFGSILIGMYVKRSQNSNQKTWSIIIKFAFFCIFTVLYFFTTVWVRSNSNYYIFQFVVPASLLGMLYFLMSFMVSIEKVLKKIPAIFLNIFGFISNLTLEIYVVQLIIIKALEDIVFPINWLLITASIICAAAVLKLFTYVISNKLNDWLLKPNMVTERN